MGRSVSYPSNAVVAYNTWEADEDADFQWDVIDDLVNYAPTLWPSLTPCDRWLGREDHAVLENEHAYVGVSEYCGLVAYWIVAKDTDNGLAERWVAQVAPKFVKTFGRLRRLGTFSNGEAIFEAA